MKYVPLGQTGIKVSRLCLGTMNFLKVDENKEEAHKIIHSALDAGVNFVDTADCYGDSELIVGEALQGRRNDVVLATKCWVPQGKGPNAGGSSRLHILRAAERALTRLKTDWIDLFIMHRPDQVWPGAPIEETLSALTDLVRQGKVRYVGTSCYHAWRLAEADWTSRCHAFERFCTEQLNYNIMNRYVEKEILGVCEKYRLGVTVFSALNYGWLSGKYRRGAQPPADSRAARGFKIRIGPESEGNFDIIEKLAPLAEERGMSLAQFSLAWVLKNPAITSVIAGPRLVNQLNDNLKALEVELDDAAMQAVDEIVKPGVGSDGEYPSILQIKAKS